MNLTHFSFPQISKKLLESDESDFYTSDVHISDIIVHCNCVSTTYVSFEINPRVAGVEVLGRTPYVG